MILHILAGDSLAEHFPASIAGDRLVCRECLIDGDLQAESLADFWQVRAQFIADCYSFDNYAELVIQEFARLADYPVDTEINLWFEYELFCQTNLWFVIDLLNSQGFSHIHLVYPHRNTDDLWPSFPLGNADELLACYRKRLHLNAEDVALAVSLWRAYQKGDLNLLADLSVQQTPAFPSLAAVCTAEINRKKEQAIEKCLQAIITSGVKDFPRVFQQFQAQAGVYGLGDLQVKRYYDQIIAA